ncbi:MAG: UDP-glucuronic acid decarboxylase family protein [Candidatus Beckwithbacteria bacterium]
MSKLALVTGGAGFIGSHLGESLLRDEIEVICLDNFSTGSKNNVAHLLDKKGFLLINADVTKRLPEVISESKIDYIFHLASPASPNESSPISYVNLPLETMDANSIGTRRLLRLAKNKQAKFLYASTSEVYGDPSIHPQPESYWGYVNPNGVRSCYDESKRFGEALSMVYLRKFDVDVRIVRIFNTYGPRMDMRDGRAIVNFIIQALQNQPITIFGKGKQTRSFCYVSDMVEGLKKLMIKEKTKGEVVNIGNPEEYSILQLANKIKKATGSKSKIEFGSLPEDDPDKRRPDISKAKKLLDWQPKVRFSVGLEKTIEYLKKQLELT